MRSPRLFLVDSSVWIEVIARGHRDPALELRIHELSRADSLAITGLVKLEVLGGFRNELEYRRWENRLAGVHLIETEEQRWEEAARLGSTLRRQGLAIPSTDLLIGAVAIAAGATVLHRDHHFDLIAQHAPLSVESHVTAPGARR